MTKMELARKIYALTPSLHPSDKASAKYLFPDDEERTASKMADIFTKNQLQKILEERAANYDILSGVPDAKQSA